VNRPAAARLARCYNFTVNRFVTPTTVVAVAALFALYALGAWFMLALRTYARLHPELNVRFPGNAALNLLAAVALTAVTRALLRLRSRLRRTAAGRCPTCGYDLRRRPTAARSAADLHPAIDAAPSLPFPTIDQLPDQRDGC
jgi:hypothetical protein